MLPENYEVLRFALGISFILTHMFVATVIFMECGRDESEKRVLHNVLRPESN